MVDILGPYKQRKIPYMIHEIKIIVKLILQAAIKNRADRWVSSHKYNCSGVCLVGLFSKYPSWIKNSISSWQLGGSDWKQIQLWLCCFVRSTHWVYYTVNYLLYLQHLEKQIDAPNGLQGLCYLCRIIGLRMPQESEYLLEFICCRSNVRLILLNRMKITV